MPQNQARLYPGDVITVSGKKVNFIVVDYRNKGAQSDDGPSIEFDCLEFGAALSANYGIRSLKVTNPKIDTFHITEQGMTGRGRGVGCGGLREGVLVRRIGRRRSPKRKARG